MLASIVANTVALEELKSTLGKYMAKIHKKDFVSSSMSKAAIKDQTHISFNTTHPVRALRSKREPINTPHDIHHGYGAKANAAANPCSLDDSKAYILAKAETER